MIILFIRLNRALTSLSLLELESPPSAFSPVLLSFLHAGIARQVVTAAKQMLECGIERAKRPRDGMTDCAGLAGKTAAADVRDHIHFSDKIPGFQRLFDNHLKRRPAEILGKASSVDFDGAGSFVELNPRSRFFAAARGKFFVRRRFKQIFCGHYLSSFTEQSLGFWAWWGCSLPA